MFNYLGKAWPMEVQIGTRAQDKSDNLEGSVAKELAKRKDRVEAIKCQCAAN
jgi:hypothetical protein